VKPLDTLDIFTTNFERQGTIYAPAVATYDPLRDLSKDNEPKTPHEEKLFALKTKLAARILRQIYLARKHPLEFYRLCFRDDEGAPVEIMGFHEQWATFLLQNRIGMIESPRDTAKTTFLRALTLWFFGKLPNWRWRLLCCDDNTARKRLAAIRNEIERNAYVQMVFPKLELDNDQRNDKSVITIKRDAIHVDPTLEACGVMSSGTGSRCEGLILDDIVSYRNALAQPSERDAVINKMDGDWMQTWLAKIGRLWDVFTPWHDEDYNCTKAKAGRWPHIRYHHGVPGNPYHSMWPSRYPEENLKAARIDMGALGYARAYLCQPLSRDAILVLPEHLATYSAADLPVDILQSCIAVLYVDPAKGKAQEKGKDPDYHGVSIDLVHIPPDSVTYGYPFRIFRVLCHGMRCSQSQLISYLIELCNIWRIGYLVIEDVGLQVIHEWILERSNQLPQIIPDPVGNLGKGLRLQRITPLLDVPEGMNKLVLFHPDTVPSNPQPYFVSITLQDGSVIQIECFPQLRKQTLNFPTKHDDCLDTLTGGLWWIYQNLIPKSEHRRAEGRVAVETAVISMGESDTRDETIPLVQRIPGIIMEP